MGGPDMEPDAALDVIQEGSDGPGPRMAFTIEGPDMEPKAPDAEVDEDDGSPSNYLNLNQEDEENLEGEEDDDVEGPNQDNDGTQTSFQVRHGRGPNKQPSGRYVITEISDARDPLQPDTTVSA
ncbi:hypothetical protein PR202_ga12358 [Eleusine coracana subsp. coracana]|uniref:Uncharacterized protein n=1 Tax=Eleusine coracana subsp. coracana TaxID=191504 RepID=A0AAV5CC06_ELECO|nr:hypothetical protein PR202_ga12358 [Eleusine coracana subsp. coracana]